MDVKFFFYVLPQAIHFVSYEEGLCITENSVFPLLSQWTRKNSFVF